MDAVQSSYNSTLTFSSTQPRGEVRRKINENSTQLTLEGSAGVAAFGTLRNSGRIGNKLVSAVKASKNIKITKQQQLLKIFAKCEPLAKHLNNPVVKGAAGVLAGLSAATALVGSTAKIADTYNYLSESAKVQA